MGKPAARVIIDQAAHTGPIMMGSFNVIIGGKPAARKGDPITCSAHGQASIIEGSTSVLINGKPVVVLLLLLHLRDRKQQKMMLPIGRQLKILIQKMGQCQVSIQII